MDQELITLLNAASSQDLQIMMPASQQLMRLTEAASSADASSDQCISQFYPRLTRVLVSGSFDDQLQGGSDLSLDGRLIGFIYLKNTISESKIWTSLDPDQRATIKSLILDYLSRGSDSERFCNRVELVPRLSACVTDLISRLVKAEWPKGQWPDEAWKYMASDWCAYLTLHRCLRAASSFCLALRRKQLAKVIEELIMPQLLTQWQAVMSHQANTQSCVRLTQVLTTCFRVLHHRRHYNKPNFGCIEKELWLFREILQRSFETLNAIANTSDGLSIVKFSLGHLARKLSKLVAVITSYCALGACAGQQDTNGPTEMDILLMTVLRLSTKLVVQFKVDHISSSESFLPIKRSPCLHPRASIHLMTIIFKLLASDTLQAHQPLHSHTRVHSSSDCTHPALSDEGVNLIQNWLMNPTDQNIDGASHESGLHHCLVGLIDLWLPLSRPEAAALAREPEACLSLGGASIDSLPSMSAAASDESKSFRRQFTFSTIWDVDVSLREMAAGGCAFTHPPVSGLWDCPIGSGLSKAGLAGYDLDVGGWNAEGFSCRQVVETIIIQLAVFLPEAVLEVCRPLIQRLYEQGRLLLNQGIQNQQISTEGAARLVSALADQETALRLAQLCAEQFRHSQAWVQLTADLLQDVEQQTPVWLTTIARLSQAKLQTPGGDSDCIDSLAASEALSDAMVMVLSRAITLSSRHAIYSTAYNAHCLPVGAVDPVETQCRIALDKLAAFLTLDISQLTHSTANEVLADPASSLPARGDTGNSRYHAPFLSLRLVAARSLRWLVEQPLFPDTCPGEILPRLLDGTLSLIKDVTESESKIKLLQWLRSLIEVIDLTSQPHLAGPVVGMLDRLWKLGSRHAPLRASILDTVSLLISGLNASCKTGALGCQFTSSLQDNIARLVARALITAMRGYRKHDNRSTESTDIQALTGLEEDATEEEGDDPGALDSGVEALFEPALRLWASLVKGEGAAWSTGLESLMPLLVCRVTQAPDATSLTESNTSLLSRLETVEHATLFFSIARGCLRLAGVLRPTASSVQNSPNHFLTNWSEPFWHGVFLESLPRQILHPNNEGSRNGVSPFPLPVPTAPLDALFDNAASQGDESAIDEDIEHFILLSAWLSVYLDAVCLASLGLPSSTTTSTTSVDPWFETCANLLFSSLLSDRMPTVPQLPASMIGLLVLAAHRCLVRAPISAHDDINHRVSMVCLGLIARLAIAPGHW